MTSKCYVNRNIYLYLLPLLLLLSFPALCAGNTLDITHNHPAPIGQSLTYFQEPQAPLTYQQAAELFNQTTTDSNIKVIQSQQAVLSFGIDANPVWLKIDVDNTGGNNALRKLRIETSWLDNIDIYYLNAGKLSKHYQSGDAFAFQQRNVPDRFFTSDYHYPLGKTQLLIRIASTDPMVLPLYFLTSNEYQKRNEYNAYSYGLLYGAIAALLIYNLILFLALKNNSYFFYSLYLAAFLAVNITYTGHGYRFFWPEQITWQMCSPPILMIFFNISGFLFAMRFLDLKNTFPRINKGLIYLCGIISALLLFAIVSNNHFLALLLAFLFMFPFSFIMISLGLLSLRNNHLSGLYFLLGSVFAAIGSVITALAVLGVIPFNVFSYRAVELGMLIDVLLLALALAELVRVSEQKKSLAEKMARIDPLTNLGNRRNFYEKVTSIWPRMLQNEHSIALILLDIDKFKQLNDSYGHSYGDNVLVHIADTINHGKRTRDIAARWGGEEFVILLPETNHENALLIAQRIRADIEHMDLQFDNEKIVVTASLGVAILQSQQSIDELIKSADKQLYQAKQSGRNCVCIAPICS